MSRSLRAGAIGLHPRKRHLGYFEDFFLDGAGGIAPGRYKIMKIDRSCTTGRLMHWSASAGIDHRQLNERSS